MKKLIGMAGIVVFISGGLALGEVGKDMASKAGKWIGSAKISSKKVQLLQGFTQEEKGLKLMGVAPSPSESRRIFRIGTETGLILGLFGSPEWNSKMKAVARLTLDDILGKIQSLDAPESLVSLINEIKEKVDVSAEEKAEPREKVSKFADSLVEFFTEKYGEEGMVSFSLGMWVVAAKANILLSDRLEQELWGMIDKFRAYLMEQEQTPSRKKVTNAMRAIGNVFSEEETITASDRKVLEKALQDIVENYAV